MKVQATKCTQRQLAYLKYWQSRGYRFGRNEKAPENTVTPPSFATRHPIIDATAGAILLAGTFGTAGALLIAYGANLL